MMRQTPDRVRRFHIDGQLGRCAPAFDSEGVICIGSRGGWLSTVSAHGDLNWRVRIGGDLGDSPVAVSDDGRILVAPDHGQIVSVDRDGSILWGSVGNGRSSMLMSAAHVHRRDRQAGCRGQQDSRTISRHPFRCLPRSVRPRRFTVGRKTVAVEVPNQVRIEQQTGETPEALAMPAARSVESTPTDFRTGATCELVVSVVAASQDVAPETLSIDDALFGPCADDVERFVLIMDLEMAFHFGIPEGTVDRCETVGDLVRLLEELDNAK